MMIIMITTTIMTNDNKLERKREVPWPDATFAWKQDRKLTE
jgi:hypothetical protein